MPHSEETDYANTADVMNAIESALDKIRAALAYAGLTYRHAPSVPHYSIIHPAGVPTVVFDLQIEVPLSFTPATTPRTESRTDAVGRRTDEAPGAGRHGGRRGRCPRHVTVAASTRSAAPPGRRTPTPARAMQSPGST